MMKAFLEMKFSELGLRPSAYAIFTNRDGFLFRYSNATGEYKPIKPHLGNARSLGNRGAYFYFMAKWRKFRVNQDDIKKHGVCATPWDVLDGRYINLEDLES